MLRFHPSHGEAGFIFISRPVDSDNVIISQEKLSK